MASKRASHSTLPYNLGPWKKKACPRSPMYQAHRLAGSFQSVPSNGESYGSLRNYHRMKPVARCLTYFLMFRPNNNQTVSSSGSPQENRKILRCSEQIEMTQPACGLGTLENGGMLSFSRDQGSFGAFTKQGPIRKINRSIRFASRSTLNEILTPYSFLVRISEKPKAVHAKYDPLFSFFLFKQVPG